MKSTVPVSISNTLEGAPKAALPKRTARKVFISLRLKVLVVFTLVFALVFAGAFYWFYTFATNQAINQIEADLLDVLAGATNGINVDQFTALAKDGVVRADGYTDDPLYWEHVQWLKQVQRISPRANIYTYIKGARDKEVIFIGSTGALDNPPFGVKFKDHYTSTGRGSANLLTGLDHVGAKTTIYQDQFGSWMSGYGPIKNAKGQIVGAVGVDFRADYVLQVQQSILNSMWAAFGITYLILFGLVFLISRSLTRPIAMLTRVAEKIGEGKYDQDLSRYTRRGLIHDEINMLADVFLVMVTKVKEREQNLRNQVEELKIVIDENKRKDQVNEIVDSDFFKALQTKARTIRGRMQDQENNTMARIISIHSFRGGTGKSNTTANLTAAMASQGYRVGVVDTDIQSPGIHILFGLTDTSVGYSLNDYLWGKCEISQAAHDVTETMAGATKGKVFLIPSSIKAGEIARVLREGYDVGLLNDGYRQLIDNLKLDVLMIDTHPGLNEETLLSIAISDVLGIIMRPDQQDYQGTSVTVEVARKLEVPRMFLVVNKVPTSFNMEDVRIRVEKTYNCDVAAVIPHSEEMMTLASAGIFTLRYPTHPMTKQYYKVAQLMMA